MNSKTNKGITLIALVITIIVLLILAGVTISMVLGDDGIIQNAQAAKEANNIAKEKEAIELAVGEASTSQYFNEILSTSELVEKLGGEETDYTDSQIVYVKEFDDGNVPIPKGMAYAFGDKVDEGIVVVDSYGNEYVWVPVETFSDFAVLQYNSTTNYRGQLWATTTGNNFGTKNETYNNYSTLKEPSAITGLPDGTGTSYDGDEINITTIKEEKYSTLAEQFQDEYNLMVKSVKTYKGFYVGRYETS